MSYYAYLYLRQDGTPYYIGKGSGRRAFLKDNHVCCRPTDKSRIVILSRMTEAEAFETEKELILNWGRKDLGTGILHNRTGGGENPPRNQQGLKNVQNGHWAKVCTFSTRSKGGKKSAKRFTSAYQSRVGKVGGSVVGQHNAETGHCASIAGLGGHTRWHVKKNIVVEDCLHCKARLQI